MEGDYINIMKTTFDFNFDLYPAFKQHELKTLEWDIINSEITSLNSCGEQAIFKLDINYSTGYLDISF